MYPAKYPPNNEMINNNEKLFLRTIGKSRYKYPESNLNSNKEAIMHVPGKAKAKKSYMRLKNLSIYHL